MKSAVETLSPTRVKLTVEVPFEELKPSLDAAYKTIAGQVNMPGFRKGKVPPRLIDQRFGRGAVLEEAVNEALPRFYGQAVEEHEVKAIGQPEVDVTEFNDGEPARVHRRGRRAPRVRPARLPRPRGHRGRRRGRRGRRDRGARPAARALRHAHRRRPRGRRRRLRRPRHRRHPRRRPGRRRHRQRPVVRDRLGAARHRGPGRRPDRAVPGRLDGPDVQPDQRPSGRTSRSTWRSP